MARPKSEDKKQALLEAATQAIAQSGIAASTAVIARNAGVAEGTLFRYFATKDELINTLYLHLKQDLCQSMIMELDRSITDAKMMTRFIWNSYISWGLNHPALITASQAWAQTNALALRDSADIRLTGPATLFGTVQEGALKMLETLRCPVSGYEFEEFIHGIYNAFNAQSALIMLDPQPDARQDRLAQILGEWTPSIYRIGPQVENNGLNLNFPFVNDEDFAVFEYIIPLQMLCAILPPQKGINPAIPKDPQFHQKMKSKQEI